MKRFLKRITENTEIFSKKLISLNITSISNSLPFPATLPTLSTSRGGVGAPFPGVLFPLFPKY